MDAQEQRRLLELAAKAIGWTIFDWYGDRHTAHDGEKLVPFNPLTDDGDALRLAVKLHMFDAGSFMHFRLLETRADPARDDYEITRLAIVRAAAAIGEKMDAKL